MSTSKLNVGARRNPLLVYHPIQGGVEILLVSSTERKKASEIYDRKLQTKD